MRLRCATYCAVQPSYRPPALVVVHGPVYEKLGWLSGRVICVDVSSPPRSVVKVICAFLVLYKSDGEHGART